MFSILNKRNKYFHLLNTSLSCLLAFILFIAAVNIPLLVTSSPGSLYRITGYISTDAGSTTNFRANFKIDVQGTALTSTSDGNGYFEIKNVPCNISGLSLIITKPNYLSLQIDNIIVKSDTVIALQDAPAILWAGDIFNGVSQDNAINMSDVMVVANAFNSVKGDSRYNVNCDLNMDSSINMGDVMLVARHFNKSSSDYPACPVTYVSPVPNNTPMNTPIYTFTPTSITSPTPDASIIDKFGIKELNSTMDGGHQWFSKFDQGLQRAFTWGQDSIDPELIFRGSGNYVIYGSTGEKAGQMKVSGSTPRIYVRGSPSESVPPPAGTPKWNNVEVTFYAITTNSGSNVGYAGIEAVVKTNHCPDSDDCTTRGYGGRILFDGRVDIEKECSHKNGGNKRIPAVYPWPEKGRMPLNKWIGFKMVARNCENNTKCRIEVYRDLTEGQNGGNWELLTSFTDYEGWSSDTPSCCEQHRGKVLLEPNYSVYLRTDGLGEQFYKWFSIREINPLP